MRIASISSFWRVSAPFRGRGSQKQARPVEGEAEMVDVLDLQ